MLALAIVVSKCTVTLKGNITVILLFEYIPLLIFKTPCTCMALAVDHQCVACCFILLSIFLYVSGVSVLKILKLRETTSESDLFDTSFLRCLFASSFFEVHVPTTVVRILMLMSARELKCVKIFLKGSVLLVNR